MTPLKSQKWFIVALLLIIISGVIVLSSTRTGRHPAWTFASTPESESQPNCVFDGTQLVSYSVSMPNAYPWASIPALKKVLSLEFFSVQIQSNQIRFISGIYEEQSPFGSYQPESGEEQYGSYGSYQEDYPRVVKDPETTVGRSRLIGGGRFEVELVGGKISRFRTAPHTDDFYVFNGMWELPSQDPELNEYMEGFVQIAVDYANKCR